MNFSLDEIEQNRTFVQKSGVEKLILQDKRNLILAPASSVFVQYVEGSQNISYVFIQKRWLTHDELSH